MTDQSMSQPLSAELVESIDALIAEAGIKTNKALIASILTTGLQLGQERTERLDLKITSSALIEMHNGFRLFAPFHGIRKVSVFGSARTRMDDPLYLHARDVAAAFAEKGWMAVTGAGPGIMQAAAEGAGSSMSLGVSIRLPFEEKANEMVAASDQVVSMKYFFTRKVMLMKESSAFVCLPGGFGTMDEMFELLTLQQTGKAEPVPIVLLDAPDGTFWSGLERFVDEQMVPSGVVSAHDYDRVLMTDSVEVALAEILKFWKNYDSLRWVGDDLVFRLRAEPTDEEIASLNEEFEGNLCDGPIRRTTPLPPEIADKDQLDLPRLVFRIHQREVGALYRLIGAINAFESAPTDS